MLESLVAGILNRVLGNYVSNLNYDQLKIGIWKGEVNLKNLKLRKEALDKLDLPVDVLEGYLGELTLSIPWANLKTKPVKVFVDHVYLLAVPKSEVSISPAEEEERAQMLKQRRLATAELLEDSQTHGDQSKKIQGENDGFIGQLTTKVIDNLQLSINNIHIRYEDSVSDQGHLFAAGMTLKELSAVSTNGEWTPTFISEMTNTIHKLTTLNSLSVYWDTNAKSMAGLPQEEALKAFTHLIPCGEDISQQHQYIVKPVSGTGKIKLNKKFDNSVAKTDVTLMFDELAFSLDDDQYRNVIQMIDVFHANLKKQKYHRFRPKTGTPKTNPRAYIRFAGQAVLADIHDRNYRWSWEHFRKRRDERLAYVELYIDFKKNIADTNQLEVLEELERDLSFEDIRFYRSIAKSKLRRDKVKLEEENKRISAQNKGWLSSWWNGSSKQSHTEEDESLVMSAEQKQELYDAIEYNEDTVKIAATVDMPKDTMMFSLSTKLKKGSFSLLRNSSSERQQLASVVFDNVTADVTQYVESIKLAAGLGDLKLFDGMTKDSLYPQWVGVKKSKDDRLTIKNAKEMKETKPSVSDSISLVESDPFFYLVLEHKPLSKMADNALYLSMRHLEIIYNPTVIQGIIQFFKPPQAKMESVNALMEAAGDTIENFKQQTRAGLEFALNKHTTILLDVNMDAPLFIIPENCFHEDSPALIIDAGHINIDSDLANQELVNEFKAKSDKKYSEEDYKNLEGLMYDKFNVQLTQTKVLIGTDLQQCLSQLHTKKRGDYDAHLIERINMQFLVELCILPGMNQFTKFKVSGHLPLLTVNFSNNKYKTMMRMIDVLVPPSANDTLETAVHSAMTDVKDMSNPDYVPDATTKNLWRLSSQEILLSDTTDSLDSLDSSRSLVPVVNAQQEQFKFSFKVDKVSVAINESMNGRDTLLAEFVLEHFAFNFVSHPYDMEVQIALKTLNVIDRMEHGNDFHYLITSDNIKRIQEESNSKEKNLVNIKYLKVNRLHPLYKETYEGYDQTVDVTLSTLNIIITRSSILTLYNWVLSTFTSPPSSSPASKDSPVEGSGIVRTYSDSQLSSNSIAKKDDSTMKVMIQLESLDLVLNNCGTQLGTGQLSSGHLSVFLLPNSLKVVGKIGNFTLSDDTVHSSEDINSSSTVHVLSVLGDELMNFTYQTFDPLKDYPGYDQELFMRMESFQFLLTESVKPTLAFLSEFLAMKTVYDAARNAAFETAQQIQETSARFHFDVAIKSPVVVFPVGENTKTDKVVARLGEIRAINRFQTASRHHKNGSLADDEISLNIIQCGLYSISLKSTSVVETEGVSEIRHLPIIDDLEISFDIENAENPEAACGPATHIIGKVSDVCMSLTERQYKSLLEISDLLTSTFVGKTDPEDENSSQTTEEFSAAVVQHKDASPKSNTNSSQSAADGHNSEDSGSHENKTQVELAVSVKTISLEILHGPELAYENRHQQTLARLSFDDLDMKLQTIKDSSMRMEVQMKSMSFSDTRVQSISLFKEIIPANDQEGPQLQLKVVTSTQEDVSVMDVSVTLDSPRIMLSLDYLLLLKDFFASPFAVPVTTDAQEFAKAHRERKPEDVSFALPSSNDTTAVTTLPAASTASSTKQQLRYNINVVDVEIICLAKPESASSEAVVLSFDQLRMVQKHKLDIDLCGIGMLLCHMDRRESSSVDFVEVFDVNMSMDSSLPSPGHNITIIQLAIQPIVLRLSYHDAMLILEIVNKAMELVGSATTPTQQGQSPSSGVYLIDEEESSESAKNAQAQPLQIRNNTTSQSNALGKSKAVEPYIVLSKESLVANFEGLQLILIEDLYDLPFLEWVVQPFTVDAKDWTRALVVGVHFDMYSNNYNFKNSHWEPVLEPWVFDIKVSQDSALGTLAIEMNSEAPFYLNITHSFLESILTLSDTLTNIQPLPESAQDFKRPYLIRNWTGYEIKFWNMSDDASIKEHRIYQLKDGEEEAWTFSDWKKRRERSSMGKNYLGVQVMHVGWEELLHLSVDQESEQTYRMNPMIDGVVHRLVVEIKLEKNIKTVTFRSGLVLENQTQEPLEAVIMSKDMKLMSEVWRLEPTQQKAVPIELAYHYWVAMRPSDKYNWSSKLHWSDIIHPKCPNSVMCEPSGPDKISYIVQLNAKFDKKNASVRQYPFLIVQLKAPVQIDNSLPCDFDLTVLERDTGRKLSMTLKKGISAYLHSIKSDSALLLTLNLHNDIYTTSETITIETKKYQTFMSKPIIISAGDSNQLTLRANIIRSTKLNDSLWINLFSPYLILNKTGIPLFLKARVSSRQSKMTVQKIEASNNSEQIEPLLFSYPDLDHRNRAFLSTNDNKWSEALSFEATGSALDISLPYDNQNIIHVGIRVEEGTGKYQFTKIVTITPRFVIKNEMSQDINFCEFGSDIQKITIPSGQKLPLYQTSKSEFRWLCLQFQTMDTFWSAPFDIQEIGVTYIKINRGENRTPTLAKVSILLQEATIFINIKENSEWPYKICNYSGISVSFYQEDTVNDDYHLKSKQKDALGKQTRFTLEDKQEMDYSWDMPLAKSKLLILEVGDKKRSINFQAIGVQIPFRHQKHREGSSNKDTMSIDVVADGSALILKLTEYNPINSLYRAKSYAGSTSGSTSREGSIRDRFETIDVEHVVNFTFDLHIKTIGISIIQQQVREMAFATIKGFELKYIDSNLYQSIRTSIQWLQIDNQLPGSTFPILLYPTTLPKNKNEDLAHPTFHMALDKVKDNRHGVMYFKLFSVLLQEVTFEMDEDFLSALLEFSKFSVIKEDPKNSDALLFSSEIKEPGLDQSQALYYFEEFCIQPMRLSISFVRTEEIDTENTVSESGSTPFTYVFNVFTMTLGNINDAPIKLNALMLENMRASYEDLYSRIILHYQNQVIYQLHKVLGSADFLGNPVGLFSNLSSGFGELFYEPYQGFVMSDRPQDLGIGIARGVGGFMKKSVFGVSDSMSRFTGSLGKGLSAATMDKKFQDRRRINLTRNKPRHAMYGVTQGVAYFGTSIASGVAGLVKRPMEGAETGGVTGFMGGLGRGLVGYVPFTFHLLYKKKDKHKLINTFFLCGTSSVVTKPVVGIFDLASNVTAGIRETTTVFDENDLARERLPRHVGRDKILMVFSQREALGQMWLQETSNGRFFHETYIAHCTVASDERVVLLTFQRILVIQTRKRVLEWEQSLEEIVSCKNTHEGIALYLQNARTCNVPVHEETSRIWFIQQIESTLAWRKEEKSRE
ncbi:hypothetical protein BDF14DRAFT_1998124 [Spinellus fusiger]|nr:hypothetical protein BDF14DRAFT_1998124 [Spinellus fusiger]